MPTDLLTEMSAPGAGIRRLRMSWEDYLALPHDLFAEWVDGEVVVSPRPSQVHGAAVVRLGSVLLTALPDLTVLSDTGVWLPGNRLRGPDLTAVATMSTSTFVEEPPVLVVEVLSPSTRAEDTLRKSPEYAAAGVGQFWVVDPDHRTLDAYGNVDGQWEPLLHLDEDHPRGDVTVGDHGVVPLDLSAILPR